MNAQALNQEIKSGNVKFIPPQQSQPLPQDLQPPDDTMTQFLGLLTAVRQPRLSIAIPPTVIPKTFLDQIQFYDDGTNCRLYLYVNKVWRYVALT
jgi:hypothetical protein